MRRGPPVGSDPRGGPRSPARAIKSMSFPALENPTPIRRCRNDMEAVPLLHDEPSGFVVERIGLDPRVVARATSTRSFVFFSSYCGFAWRFRNLTRAAVS